MQNYIQYKISPGKGAFSVYEHFVFYIPDPLAYSVAYLDCLSLPNTCTKSKIIGLSSKITLQRKGTYVT
jgi:hypothetical protein